MEFEWKEPPPTTGNGGSKPGHTPRQRELNEFAELLHKNPGKYALIGQQPYAGANASFRRRGLEVATRKRPDGQYDVYVRAPWH